MPVSRTRKLRILWSLVLLFVLANIAAALHAYRFTHFNATLTEKVKPESMSFKRKLIALLTGAPVARPQLEASPSRPYETIKLDGKYPTEGWYIPASECKGTVLICHGYGSCKSGMLDKADYFLDQGYNTFLIDFMGAGAAEGNQTTIGYKEAEQVAAVVHLLQQKGEQHIILFGTSMGAAAIMRYLSMVPQDHISAAILECPFGSLLQTVSARFKVMGLPAAPMAHLLVFWGGIENGFNAFEHQPEVYARNISCPVLLMQGGKDKYVSRAETDAIYQNLKGKKTLKIYELSGHENYLLRYKEQWMQDVSDFLKASREP